MRTAEARARYYCSTVGERVVALDWVRFASNACSDAATHAAAASLWAAGL